MTQFPSSNVPAVGVTKDMDVAQATQAALEQAKSLDDQFRSIASEMYPDSPELIESSIRNNSLQKVAVSSAQQMLTATQDESVSGYLGESLVEAGASLGDSLLTGIRAGLSQVRENPAALLRYAMTIPLGPIGLLAPDSAKKQSDELLNSIIPDTGLTVGDLELAPKMADLGRELTATEKKREPSQYDSYYISPQDIGGVAGSIALSVATIASGGAAAPVTIPALAAQAAGSVYGEYAKVLGENPDMEYDPRIGAALTLLVALETAGSVGALITLPKAMASRAFKNGLKNAASPKKIAAAIAAEGGALAVEGAEEYVEEGLEALVTVMYKPEFEGLRDSIVSGEIGADEFDTMIELATAGGLKTFLLGAAGGGAGRVTAGIKQKGGAKAASEAEARIAETVRDIRQEERIETPIEAPADSPVEATEVGGESVADPDDGRELTVSDLDSDSYADRIIQSNSSGVDSLFVTPTGKVRARKAAPSRKEMIDAGVIPEGMKTTKEERQSIYERLKAARERAAAVTEETIGPEAPTETPAAGVPIEPDADPLAGIEEAQQRLAMLEDELAEAEPGSDESFELGIAISQAQTDIQSIDPSIEFSRSEFADQQEASPSSIQSSELVEEPGTQMGSMPGGLATSSRTGRRYYVKRYENQEQTRNEAVANRLYDAAGVRVPNVSLLRDDDGNVIGVASEIVPGLRSEFAEDASDGLVIDAWLANWDVVGDSGDNLMSDSEGNSVRIDQGGALTTRAQGAPKGKAFGPKVGEMASIPEANEAMQNASPSSLRAGFDSLRAITDKQIKDIVKANSVGDTAADNRLIATLIKRRKDLLSQEADFVSQGDIEFSLAEDNAAVQKANQTEGTDYVVVPEGDASLTDGEKALKKRTEQRLGRRVVYLRSPSGNVGHNGFIQRSRDGVINIVLARDIGETAKAVAKKRGVSEKQVIEDYEMALLQTVLHENIHLTEGIIDGDLTPEQERLQSDSSRVLNHILSNRFGQRRIEMLSKRLAKAAKQLKDGVITEEQYAVERSTFDREMVAETLTDMRALSQSGIETLFLDRGRFRAAINRLKRIANRIGGPKDVKIISRVIENMEAGTAPLPSSPSVPMYSVSTEAFLASRPELQFSRNTSLFSESDQVVIPLIDIASAVENPTPENVLQLFVSRGRWASIGGITGSPGDSSYETSTKTITAALHKLGITPTPEIIDHVIKNYNKTKRRESYEELPTELRGANEVYAPAGEVEGEMSLLFDRTPSPTAAQLQTMPGSPEPRAKVTKFEAKTGNEKAAKEFIDNVIQGVKAVEGNVVTTDNQAKIETLLKTNDVVIYTGGTKPYVHANQSWTDRFAKATDYQVIKDTTIEAAKAGYHNWYREFGKFFKSLGGDRMVNEAAMIFGVTSAQSAVENNIADTMHIMRLAREHFRDGKPRTVEALMQSFAPLILDKNGNKIYESQEKREKNEPKRESLKRRTKFTANGTAAMFVSGPQLEVIADFYINGAPKEGGAIKIRTYAGQIAEAARNSYYPFSVQDRHQAAMYGFFKGTFNPKTGKFSYDKVFRSGDNALEFRYASYLTQRLSMEPELRGLTPSQIQALQWFHTKAGKGPYPEIEAKTDKGLIANFAADNPDITTGTLVSAMKFAEFEVADFLSIMESSDDATRFPAADIEVPSFIHGPSGYSQGQAIARDFGGRMAVDGPRVQLIGDPGISAPGLIAPEGMSEMQMDSMYRAIIETVTETDGSIRILNDMGLPHTPLVSLAGSVNGVPSRGLHMVPLVGSISSPETARVVGAVVGLGTMQPRMATSTPSPGGNAVTIRIKRADGEPMSQAAAMSLVNKTTVLGKGNGETWQTSSPTNDYVEVTVTPKGSIDDGLLATTFEQIKKEFKNETGSEIIGEAHRVEYEVVEQGQYAEIISGSGLSLPTQGPSGVLGRVVGEVTSPVLSALEANGFGFNRNQFQEGFGFDRQVVERIPQIEFSRATEEGVMPLSEQDEMRRLGGEMQAGEYITPRNVTFGTSGQLANNALVEFDWWMGLDQDERTLMNMWQTGNTRRLSNEYAFYDEGSSLLENLRDAHKFVDAYPADAFTTMKGVGLLEYGSLALGILDPAKSRFQSPGPGGRKINELDKWYDTEEKRSAVARAIAKTVKATSAMEGNDLSLMLGNDGEMDPSRIFISDSGRVFIEIDEVMAEDYSSSRIKNISERGGALHYELTSISGGGIARLAKDLSIDIASYGEVTPEEASVLFGKNFYQEILDSPEAAGGSGIARLGRFMYNDMVRAMAKGPVIKADKIYRAADSVPYQKMKDTFVVGGRFKIATPASASAVQDAALRFHGGLEGFSEYMKSGGRPPEGIERYSGTHFVIESPKTARAIGMSSAKMQSRKFSDGDTFVGYTNMGKSFGGNAIMDESLSEFIEENTGVRPDSDRSMDAEAAGANREDVDFYTSFAYETSLLAKQRDMPYSEQEARDSLSQGSVNSMLVAMNLANDFSDLRKTGMTQEQISSMMTVPGMEDIVFDEGRGAYETPSFFMNELEAVAMPGTVYEILEMSPNRVVVKELELSAEDSASIPVLTEFSREDGTPRPTSTDDADSSTRSTADVKWKNKPVRRTIQDRFIELDYLQRDIEQAWGSSIDLKSDALNRIRNMPGRIAHAAERFSDRVLKPLADEVAKEGMTQAEFGEYAAAKHAIQVNAQMRSSGNPKAVSGEIDSGLSDSAAQEIIARVEDSPNFEKIESLRQRLVSIGRKNLRIAYRSGLISRNYYEGLLSNYGDTYVPLWDAFDDQTSKANEGTEQFLVPSSIVKQRTGRSANSLAGNTKFFEDRFAAMADQRYRVIRKSENNAVLTRLLSLTKDLGNSDLLAVYEPAIVPVIDSKGRTRMIPDPNRPATVFRVMVQGKEVLLDINHPGLAKAMKNANESKAPNKLVSSLSFFASMQRFFATQFGNPDFTLTNPVRDIQTAAASTIGERQDLRSISESGEAKKLSLSDRLRIVTKSTGGLIRAFSTVLGGTSVGLGGTEQSRREYAQYRALGGRQGFFKEQDPNVSRKALQKIARQAPKDGVMYDFGKLTTAAPRSFVKAWSHINTMFDDGVRFATYQQLVRSGVNPEKAVETTRDLTVDFSRMGTAGPTVNSMYAFSNAALQGSTKTLRLMKSKSGNAILTSYFLTGLVLESLNGADDEDRDDNLKSDWQQIPDYQKDGNFHIPIGGGEYIKFPVAYGLAIPYVAGRKLVQLLRGEIGAGEAIGDTLTSTYTQMNPFGSEELRFDSVEDIGSSVGRILSPSAIDPLIDVVTNKDWRGSRIYNEPFPSEVNPMRSQMGRSELRGSESMFSPLTDDWAPHLAEFVSTITGADYSESGQMVSPGAIDLQPEAFAYLFRAQFTGFGSTVDRVGGYLKTIMDGEETSVNDIPGVRRFFTQSASKSNTDMDNRRSSYEYRQVAREADEKISNLLEAGDRPGAAAARDDAFAEYRTLPNFKAWDKLRKSGRDRVKEMKARGDTEERIDSFRKKQDEKERILESKLVRKVRQIEQAQESPN